MWYDYKKPLSLKKKGGDDKQAPTIEEAVGHLITNPHPSFAQLFLKIE